MQFSSLPLEVLQITLRSIPKGSLAPASLVCKMWRSIILPLLYQSIELPQRVYVGDQGPTPFLKIIIDEDEDENKHIPRLSGYIKHLRVGPTLNKEELEIFGAAVVKMKNLERLDWSVSSLEDLGWYTTLVLLCQELPKFRSLILAMAQNEIPLGDLDKCVAFTNLRELSITFDGIPADPFESGLPHTLVDLIRGARNIESLCLYFEEDEGGWADPWEHRDLFSELVSDYFPNLRVLEIQSQHLVPIDDHSGPEFRQFIQNHSRLEKIRLLTGGCNYDLSPPDQSSLTMTPNGLETLMPCVRHLAGPSILVEALLRSKLAEQIELLELHEPAVAKLGSISDFLSDLDSSTLPELPSLRGLGVFSDQVEERDEWEITLNALSKLAPRMPKLRELVLCLDEKPGPDELDRLLRILDHLPHLRRLVTHVQGYPVNWHRDDVIKDFYQRAKASCRLLDIEDSGDPVLQLSL